MKKEYMLEALKEAKKAFELNEVPIGCVIVKNDEIIARAHNMKENNQQTVDHAEMIAINLASKKLGTWHLDDSDIYVTLEPCAMCASCIMQSRIKNVYFGAYDKSGGALGSIFNLYELKGFNYYPSYYGGIMEEECRAIIKEFFKKIREK